MATWDATTVIMLKRDHQPLPAEAIRWFINAYTDGTVADEQASALAMAVFLNGLSEHELTVWTDAMIDTGIRATHQGLGLPLVDKHSTGGVGDKVSLILCPLIAALGGMVMPQLAGRGLGHTGGTIDKMEAIPGWNPELSPAAMSAALQSVGAVIAAASDKIAPADKKLYALRDTTGTVASIPLIASSIMSKKIAGGTEFLVLDVKVGRGAFMRNLDDARELAETMVGIGNRAGVKTSALLTRMDQPLGRMIGNTIEVDESVEVLQGGGPRDLIDVTVALAQEMMALAGVAGDAADLLAAGGALGKWNDMVRVQGGDPDAAREYAPHQHDVVAPSEGFVTDMDALDFGLASMRLGAGRARKEDSIDMGAGIQILKKPGEAVSEGEPVLRLFAHDSSRFAGANELLDTAVSYGTEQPDIPSAVIERIA